MANNIITNHTLEQYNKKYRNRRYRLLKVTKKEVEDFDKKNPTKTKGYLLSGRKWCLIGDTYYEIPKAPRYTWFRNLNAGVQTAVCLLGAGVVATAVTVPLVLLNQNKSSEHIAIIDPDIKDVTCTQKKLDNGALEITLKYDTSKKELDTLDIYMGNEKLVLNTDYTLEGNKIVIAADVLGKNKTKEITIKPKLKDKTPVVTKDEWFTIADKWYGDFNKSRTEYTSNQIKFIYNNKQGEFKTLVYDKDDNGQRFAKISLDSEKYGITGYYIASSDDTKEGYFYKKLKSHDTEGVKYTITNDELIYIDDKAVKEDVCEFRINKDGYITKEVDKIGELETDVESFEFVYNGEQKLYYNIDWNKTAFDLKDDGIKKTLWDFAKEATKIEFIKDETIGDVCVGKTIGESTERDPIYASYITKDADEILTIWSKEKISFVDDDRITKQQGFFYGCQKVASINFINIDTHKVTNFNNTFVNCDSLKDANFKYFDTSNAVDMNNMFYFTQFEHLDLSSFNTSNVTNMFSMFANSFNLKTINLSSFNTSNVKNMGYMFQMDIAQGTSQLETIYASNKFNTDNVTNSTGMFTSCQKLVGGKGTTYNSSKIDKSYARIDQGPDSSAPGYFTDIEQKPYDIDWATKIVDGTNTLYDLAKTATSIEFLKSDSTEGTHCGETDNDKVYYSLKDGALKIWANKKIAFEDDDCPSNGGVFKNCSEVTLFNFTNIDTSKVTNFASFFSLCKKIESLDLSNFDTSHGTTMKKMFSNCIKLNSLNMDNFNTSNVTNMSDMFNMCKELTTLDLSSFNTSNVADMGYMFDTCESLNTIYVSNNFVTTSVTNSSYMFKSCAKLTGAAGSTLTSIQALDSEHYLDATYARVDKGNTKDTAGYFSEVKELKCDEWSFYKSDVIPADDLKKGTYRFKLKITESVNQVNRFIFDPSDFYGVAVVPDLSNSKIYVNGVELEGVSLDYGVRLAFPTQSKVGDVITFEIATTADAENDIIAKVFYANY